MHKLLIVALLLFVAGCTSPDNTERTLTDSGYSDVQVGGYAWLTCGNDDTFATKFTATNPAGKTVSGAVCCGWFGKGCTIRF